MQETEIIAKHPGAIPFDKGVGICLMKKEAYEEKLSEILQLRQFEKVTDTRKNAKHANFKEEERVTTKLKELKNEGKIDAATYNKIRSSCRTIEPTSTLIRYGKSP